MHPALLRLIAILAECEADRLCAEKENAPDAENVEGEERLPKHDCARSNHA
jgi:hypothetical protein